MTRTGMTVEHDTVRHLRRARAELNMSQKGLADGMRRLGHLTWRQSTAAKVEGGSRPLGLAEAIDLAHVVAIEPADLLGIGDIGIAYETGLAYYCKACPFSSSERLAMVQHTASHEAERSMS